MRRVIQIFGFGLCIVAAGVHAQREEESDLWQERYKLPTDVVCHSKEAMREVMSSGDPAVITKLIKSGDCLLVSDEAIKDASAATDNGKGPAKVSVEISQRVVELWGYYVF